MLNFLYFSSKFEVEFFLSHLIKNLSNSLFLAGQLVCQQPTSFRQTGLQKCGAIYFMYTVEDGLCSTLADFFIKYTVSAHSKRKKDFRMGHPLNNSEDFYMRQFRTLKSFKKIFFN
jgi:hypothetical protein